MIRIVEVTEWDVDSFDFWGRAAFVVETAKENPHVKQILETELDAFTGIEDRCPTDVNDFVWFEFEDILNEEYHLNLDGSDYV